MRNLMTALACTLALASSAAFANAHKEAPDMKAGASAPPKSKQQTKMGTCNADAGDRKGDERKAFMKECLSAKPTQQTRMKTCNADAGDKKGDERKTFMKECLSK